MNEIIEASDKHYFQSYDHFGIHEEMLKDTVRTLSYRDAIYRNKELFEGKVVLDVGCGSGILSMFAAKAGARQVIGVDNSDIIDMARLVVNDNNLSDKITLVKGKMEEITLPVKEVDIIISEWMGYFLLYEAMLDTVLYARDKYLKKGGLILPDKAIMNIAAIEDANYKSEKVGFWENVYGFDYSRFSPLVLKEPLVDSVEDHCLLTPSCEFFTIDLNTVTKEDLAFSCDFSLSSTTKDVFHGFVVWFDIGFEHLNKNVYFSTGPAAKYTHWKQTVFYTETDSLLEFGDEVNGRISIRPGDKNPRDVIIKLDYTVKNDKEDLFGPATLNYLLC